MCRDWLRAGLLQEHVLLECKGRRAFYLVRSLAAALVLGQLKGATLHRPRTAAEGRDAQLDIPAHRILCLV